MCDPSPVRNWLIAAMVAVAVALSLVVLAGVENGSIFHAWHSPVWMVLAGLSTLAAVSFCGLALSALTTFDGCATSEGCRTASGTVRTVIGILRGALGVQAAACFTVAATAWIPFFALPAIWAVLVALAVAIASTAGALGFQQRLRSC